MCDLCFIPKCDCDATLADSPVTEPVAAGGAAVLELPAPTVTDALALDSTQHWAGDTVRYGFPDTADGFTGGGSYYSPHNEPGSQLTLSAFGRDSLREGFAQWAAVTALTITEAQPGTMAEINVGASSAPSTAWAYYPGGSAANGDIWFNTDQWFLDELAGGPAPIIGSYAYATGMHEFGHALGLKHPHQSSGGGTAILDPAYDGVEFSIMSYRSYPGGPIGAYTIETWGYPQSPMMLDIAMIQAIYGADYTTRSGDTTYTVSTATGETFVDGVSLGVPGANRVFRTIWDGDGTDHIDLSNYTTSMYADLNPGRGIEFDTDGTFQAARLANGAYAGFNIYMSLLHDGDARSLIENLTTGSGDDILVGNAADNVLDAGAGSNTVDGGAGTDTVLLSTMQVATAQMVVGPDGVITFTDGAVATSVTNVELAAFADQMLETAALLAVFEAIGATGPVTVQDLLIPPTPTEFYGQTLAVVDGTAGSDDLGSSASAVLSGLGGDDKIWLGDGDDVAIGGAGADQFVFDIRSPKQGIDLITDLDFAQDDRLSIYSKTPGVFQDDHNPDNSYWTGTDGEIAFIRSFADLEEVVASDGVWVENGDYGMVLTFSTVSEDIRLELAGFSVDMFATHASAPPPVDPVTAYFSQLGYPEITATDGRDNLFLDGQNAIYSGLAGDDRFTWDMRKVTGPAHEVIADFDFAEGDWISILTSQNGTFDQPALDGSGLWSGSNDEMLYIRSLSDLDFAASVGAIAVVDTAMGVELSVPVDGFDRTLELVGLWTSDFLTA